MNYNIENYRKQLTSSIKELDVTYPTLKKHIDNGTYPAELCLRIAKLTDGELSCAKLRPDLFPSTASIIRLGKCTIDNFESHVNNNNYELIIATLNYLENEQPNLYKDTLVEIAKLTNGKLFVSQRLAHTQDEI